MILYKVAVHFQKTSENPLIVEINSLDFERLRNSVGERTITVQDFGWSPVNPQGISINGKLINYVAEIKR